MTEFKASFAPRRKMNSNFFPFSPMLPSANACFTKPGMFISEARPRPAPEHSERLRKSRRVMTLMYGIRIRACSLFVEAVLRQQHGDHAAHARIVRAASSVAGRERVESRRADSVIRCVHPLNRRGTIFVQARL